MGMEDTGRGPSEVISNEAEQFRGGVERLPHLGILDASPTRDKWYDSSSNDGRRLV
jgi:hypothetical protein